MFRTSALNHVFSFLSCRSHLCFCIEPVALPPRFTARYYFPISPPQREFSPHSRCRSRAARSWSVRCSSLSTRVHLRCISNPSTVRAWRGRRGVVSNMNNPWGSSLCQKSIPVTGPGCNSLLLICWEPMRAPLNTCSCRFPLTPPWALIAGTKHQKQRRSSVKDTPADTDAHTHKHNGSRGRPRGGVGGEAKYSLSAGFSRIKALLLRAATVHFLPEGREKNGPEGRARSPWLPCPQIMASVQRWGHSQRKWQLPIQGRAEQTVSLVFHRKCCYADDTTLYLIVSFVVVALIEVCRQHAWR